MPAGSKTGFWTVEHSVEKWVYTPATDAYLQGSAMPEDANNHCRIDTPLLSYPGGDPLGIPDGATIKGILVECGGLGWNKELGDGGPYDLNGRIVLRAENAEVGDAKVIETYQESSKSNSLGSSVDLWGYDGWTPAIINAVGFGAKIDCPGAEFPAPPWVNVLIIELIAFSVYYSVITVISPNGGEEWRAGESRDITWVTSAEAGSEVQIALYKGGVWRLWIDRSVPASDELYAWSIPSHAVGPTLVEPGSDYKIRIYDSDSGTFDESDEDFTILPPFTGVREAFIESEDRQAILNTENRVAIIESEDREAILGDE